jgi:hypothetical protein
MTIEAPITKVTWLVVGAPDMPALVLAAGGFLASSRIPAAGNRVALPL